MCKCPDTFEYSRTDKLSFEIQNWMPRIDAKSWIVTNERSQKRFAKDDPDLSSNPPLPV